MAFQSIVDGFFEHLGNGQLLEAFYFAPFEYYQFGLNLFFTSVLIILTVAVYLKNKNWGTTSIIFFTLTYLWANLLLSEFLFTVYLLLALLIAFGIYKALKK